MRSTPDSALLVFGLAAPLRREDLPELKPDAETLDCQVLKEPAELAFSLHTALVQDCLNRQRALPGAMSVTNRPMPVGR